MKSKTAKENLDLQKLYIQRLERFMSLVELSHALKKAPRVIQKK